MHHLHNDQIGDIKYSLLEQDKFREVHGSDWELLMGQDIAVDSKLALFTGIAKLPDARGVFLRGMNLGRSTNTGDSDPNRPLGSYQKDDLKSHDHGIMTDRESVAKYSDYKRTVFEVARDETIRTQKTGGPETRPRNITVYIYVKVNESIP